MLIKAKLFFRSFQKKTINDSNCIEVRFLDENDTPFNFLFQDDQHNQKWLSMKKDTLVDLELTLYIPRDHKYAKYALWVV